MFLALAVEKLQGAIPREFMNYWTELEKLLGRPLAYKAAMTRVNKTRVNLKHYGIEPASSEVHGSIETVRGLLTDESPDIFGVELDEISLAPFFASKAAARAVNAAEMHWAADEQAEAFADLREAFDEVLDDYVERKLDAGRRGKVNFN